jgi:1,4-alpha-glucan branching enzyme
LHQGNDSVSPPGTPATAEILSEPLQRVVDARHHDPFEVLGRHPLPDGQAVVRAVRPHVQTVRLADTGADLRRLGNTDLFEWRGPASEAPGCYRLQWVYTSGQEAVEHDPYCFPPQLQSSDLEAFNQGDHNRVHRFLGAHQMTAEGILGTRFAVWAPNAERVSVVGDFNGWDGRCHPMRVRGGSGVWELFIPALGPGTLYKYEIRNRASGELLVKADPCAQATEMRPATASRVAGPPGFQWSDDEWLTRRQEQDWLHEALCIYELHAGSWRRGPDGKPLSYRQLADALVPYLTDLRFTHVELMPLTEYPLDESWGYQPTGYFAPTARYGSADDLRYLVNSLHAAGLGVILDWVPGHFPKDAHGLARFDGTTLYEYGDPRRGLHPDWGTLVFNYARNEVRSFLTSSALYWLENFHVDGLRVDAVASMLYLDYSRKAGEWTPNVHGGNEHLEAISFLKHLNETTHRECPGTLTFAEESTAWPGVTRPTFTGGLGFSLKWNMGWMHDTLAYLREDPIHRRFHHNRVTFGPVYAFSENFTLPLSHDEVVHGKGSLLGRMPGDDWQRFANLRLLYAFQWTFPGKKLLFMGQEMGQPWEWDAHQSLPWDLQKEPLHAGIQRLIRDLNELYRSHPALHQWDFNPTGFHWLRWDDADNSAISYLRIGEAAELVIAINFTPVPRPDYRLGVPRTGRYREILNTDSRFYGGSDLGNPLPGHTSPEPWMDQRQSLAVTLPPLATVVLEHIPD